MDHLAKIQTLTEMISRAESSVIIAEDENYKSNMMSKKEIVGKVRHEALQQEVGMKVNHVTRCRRTGMVTNGRGKEIMTDQEEAVKHAESVASKLEKIEVILNRLKCQGKREV